MLVLGKRVKTEKMMDLVSDLPALHRQVVKLYLENETNDEIAATVGIDKKQVAKMLKEAVLMMKGMVSYWNLEEDDFLNDDIQE